MTLEHWTPQARNAEAHNPKPTRVKTFLSPQRSLRTICLSAQQATHFRVISAIVKIFQSSNANRRHRPRLHLHLNHWTYRSKLTSVLASSVALLLAMCLLLSRIMARTSRLLPESSQLSVFLNTDAPRFHRSDNSTISLIARFQSNRRWRSSFLTCG